MRTAALRICLSGLVFSAPTLTHAALEYSVKSDVAEIFRSQTLEPPPLATLEKGETLKLIHRGASRSQVETGGGIKGWIRNGDLQAMQSAPGQNMRLGDHKVFGGGEYNHSETVFLGPFHTTPEIISLHRSFSGEIAEAIDKEQLEMRNGDN